MEELILLTIYSGEVRVIVVEVLLGTKRITGCLWAKRKYETGRKDVSDRE